MVMSIMSAPKTVDDEHEAKSIWATKKNELLMEQEKWNQACIKKTRERENTLWLAQNEFMLANRTTHRHKHQAYS